MLKILICDDRIADIEKLKTLIERYQEENSLEFEIFARSNEKEIISTLDNSERFDFLFLDIFIDKLNGIQLARHIRETNSDCKIVFFSTTKDSALDAFGVNATQYLVKPVEYESLANAMDLMLKDAGPKSKVFMIRNGTKYIKINLDDIIYCETDKHYQNIYLKKNRVERVRMSSSELFAKLSNDDDCFTKVGASYIINLKYVVSVTNDDVELEDDNSVPIPRGMFSEIRDSYKNYYLKDGND